jgi:hypothetical protein
MTRSFLVMLLAWGGCLLGPWAVAPAHGMEISVVATFMGGTLMPWEAPEETGNGYGASLGVELARDYRLSIAAGGILPDSRLQGHFGVFWLEGQWHPFTDWFVERELYLSPFALVGLGFALEDDAPEDGTAFARWSSHGLQFVSMVGLGVSYGPRPGFFVTGDIRLYNLTHGGIVLGAGYGF